MKLTVEDFMRLDETGAFRDYAKTELIEGVMWAPEAEAYVEQVQVAFREQSRGGNGRRASHRNSGI